MPGCATGLGPPGSGVCGSGVFRAGVCGEWAGRLELRRCPGALPPRAAGFAAPGRALLAVSGHELSGGRFGQWKAGRTPSRTTGPLPHLGHCPGGFGAGCTCRTVSATGDDWHSNSRERANPSPAVAVGEEAEVSDTLETRRQCVDQEAADELVGVQRHLPGLALVLVPVVVPLESDGAVVRVQDALVGDGRPVRVASEVGQPSSSA